MKTWQKYLIGGGIAVAVLGSGAGLALLRRRQQRRKSSLTEY